MITMDTHKPQEFCGPFRPLIPANARDQGLLIGRAACQPNNESLYQAAGINAGIMRGLNRKILIPANLVFHESEVVSDGYTP